MQNRVQEDRLAFTARSVFVRFNACVERKVTEQTFATAGGSIYAPNAGSLETGEANAE